MTQEKTTKKIFISKGRKKQLIIGLLAGGVALIILAVTINIKSDAKEKRKAEAVARKPRVEVTDFAKPDQFVSDESLWKNSEGAKVDQLERKLTDIEKNLARSDSKGKSNNDLLPNPPPFPADGFGNNLGVPPAPTTAQLPNANVPEERKSRIVSIDIGLAPAQPTQGQGKPLGGSQNVKRSEDFQRSEQVSRVRGIRPNIEVYEDGGDVSLSSAKFRARDSYIPSGTFFRAVLLGGVDAPTGGDAQSANPQPILLRVSDMAQLPNSFRFNFKECFVVGSAYGDLSAERAYVRTETLSCIGPDGRGIDMKIKGYVSGEDGKTGIRGTVVTKQGQILANALMAGVISGFGQGVAESYKSTTTGPFGTSSATRAGDEYKAGVASGFGSAMERMAAYYIKLADKMFPVIEINAGRELDIVLLQGIQIDTREGK